MFKIKIINLVHYLINLNKCNKNRKINKYKKLFHNNNSKNNNLLKIPKNKLKINKFLKKFNLKIILIFEDFLSK